MKTYNEKIKFLLDLKQIKQVDFAKQLGISTARLNNYLTGKAEANIELFCSIIKILDTTADYVFGLGYNYACTNINNVLDVDLTERIKGLLKFYNMKQSQLASKLNITPARLNHYLSNKAEPSYSMLINIAQIFKTTTDYILGLSDSTSHFENSNNIKITYAELDTYKLQSYINIPVFNNTSNEPYRMYKCSTLYRSLYKRPYIITMQDDSMSPVCNKGESFLIAPQSYIPPVVNNLNPYCLYVVQENKDELKFSIRYCLTKDDVIFIRPYNINYETKSYNFSKLSHNIVTGIVIEKINIDEE